MNSTTGNKIDPESRLHVVYAGFVLVLSIAVYVGIFAYLVPAIGSIYGGFFTIIMWAVMLIALGLQIILFRFIRKRRRMPIAGLFFPLPFILLMPLLIGLMDMPDRQVPDLYHHLILANLGASAVFFYFAILSGYKAAIYAAVAHAAATWCFILYCITIIQMADLKVHQAVERSQNANIKKRSEADDCCPGANKDGSPASINRYSDGKHKPDSELYYYPNGCLMTKVYIYDSLGAEYVREISFAENCFQYLRSIENRTTKESSATEYSKDTKLIAKQTRIYDSNNTRYREQLIYGKDGKLRRQSKVVVSSN